MSQSTRTRVGASYRTLREMAQEAIFRDIVEGVLKPGHKLVEADLVELYGISRGPIREALRALEGQGLVRADSNRGAVVSRLSRQETREILEIRFELEGLAARIAASKCTDDHLRQLEDLQAAMTARLGEPSEWLALNNEFHLTLYAASERPRLCRLIEEMMTTVEPYLRTFIDAPDRLLHTHADHALIIEAARVRDGARCERETRWHLQRAAEIILSLVPEEEVTPEES
jgi:DNA-binding GntR family transcriptional regulator